MQRKIHLIFKTHLDVGFTDFAAAVTHNYFKKYIPTALRVAREMRDSGCEDRFVWTTGSWLIYEFLEQASPAERADMEAGILAGDIAWHALPFTTHTELMDAELFRFGLSLSQSLDARYGRHTTAAKMTDVPGHTRAIIPLLAEAGVQFLHIGVNPGSTVPSVPGLFRWQSPDGTEVLVMYESGYGSAFEIPRLEHSLAFGHTSDNMGPQSVAQIKAVYSDIRRRMPDAEVFASTLTTFGEKLSTIRETLPVVTAEIGDTWIHGTGSDPIKVSRYRELLRLRSTWLKDGRIDYSDRHFLNFNRRLLMVPEHTWGMDEKSFLNDHENYSAARFNAARDLPNFRKFESSWVEKRAYPQLAVNALEDSPLAQEAAQRLDAIRPRRPNLSEWQPVNENSFIIESPSMSLTVDPLHAIPLSLLEKKSSREWVDPDKPLFNLAYQTFSAGQYHQFVNTYILPEQRHDWAKEDFAKPGMEEADAEARFWDTRLQGVYRQGSQFLSRLTFEEEALAKYGAPAEIYLTCTLDEHAPRLYLDLQWFNKRASRLPEALWFSFHPVAVDGAWWIEKMGSEISPLEVVENGNRHLHASGKYVTYREPGVCFTISALDSPLVAPGQRSLLDFNNRQPEMREGVHFCLYNNLWGTNFPMWFEEDCRFRFILDLSTQPEDQK